MCVFNGGMSRREEGDKIKLASRCALLELKRGAACHVTQVFNSNRTNMALVMLLSASL